MKKIRKLILQADNKWKKYFESRLPVSEAQQLMIKNDLLRQQANKMNDTIIQTKSKSVRLYTKKDPETLK